MGNECKDSFPIIQGEPLPLIHKGRWYRIDYQSGFVILKVLNIRYQNAFNENRYYTTLILADIKKMGGFTALEEEQWIKKREISFASDSGKKITELSEEDVTFELI
mgnify:CR=1 FL=1